MPQPLSSATSAFFAELGQRLEGKRAHRKEPHPPPAPSHRAGQEGGEWMGMGWLQKEHGTQSTFYLFHDCFSLFEIFPKLAVLFQH